MFCIHCGAQIPDGSKFCTSCGQAQELSAPVYQEQPQQPQYQEPVQYQQPQYQQPIQYQQPVYPQPQPYVQPAPQSYTQPIAQAAAYTAPVASAAAQVGSTAATVAAVTATTAVAGAAKATMSTGKRLAIIALVLTFLVGAFSAYLAVFVSGPVDTVEAFFDSAQNLDYQGMVDCLDPKIGRMMDATIGIMGDLIGIDIGALLDFAPFLADFVDTESLGMFDVDSVEVLLWSDDSAKELYNRMKNVDPSTIEPGTYYSDNEVIEFLYKYNIKLPGIEKLTAKSAIVSLNMTVDGITTPGYLLLENQGGGDWRIFLDMSMLAGIG